MSQALSLSPGGHLFLESDPSVEPRLEAVTEAALHAAFSVSAAHGLELLAGRLLNAPLPASVAFWRSIAATYFSALCHHGQINDAARIEIPTPPAADLARWIESAPPMRGLEYLSPGVLERIWTELGRHVRSQVAGGKAGLPSYLQAQNTAWNAVGRVTFHLAENKRSPERPFAFLATYTHRISDQGKVQHLPLGRALEEYAGARNRAALASLLSPVQRAAERSPLVRELLESRALFHPQGWTPSQAYAFLKSIPLLEASGVVVRIPDWWKAARPPRPKVSVRVGEQSHGLLGRDHLLDFNVQVTLDGEPLTDAEWQSILASTQGLVLLKGRWVEVDGGKLKEVLQHWKRVQSTAGRDGLSLLEGLRLLSGFRPEVRAEGDVPSEREDWSTVIAGRDLAQILESMQHPEAGRESDPGAELRAELRPYQRVGVHWLWFMNRLGLGACLADDMGLGKTVQVIGLLLALRQRPAAPDTPKTSLLVVPASLLANWKAELRRFAPSLSVLLAHPADTPPGTLARLASDPAAELAGTDLLITSYSMVLRQPWLKDRSWNLVVLDEAQAIKNAGARQSRAVKELRGRCRIALTGTPIENRLSDLWSLFDFLCPGLLGSARDFAAFVKRQSTAADGQAFGPLRRLVRPYILRRLKTDKSIIADLPDKTEMTAFCPLTKRQAALYQQAVQELAERLEAPETDGIQRRGVILAFLTRFKQICNHPSQWLGDGAYAPADSGKFGRLSELCEEIAARQEKVLVFSQYREMTQPLERHLAGIFGRPGLVLHGETAVKKRQELVAEFQRDGGPPFFVLSLKAGGTGLNLTAATHVVHFDRWWNPAVENQATDRAFRIGQNRNVVVHKFTCRGTVEERIDALIASKTTLAEDILGGGAERLLTEMGNGELLRFVALDLRAATAEERR